MFISPINFQNKKFNNFYQQNNSNSIFAKQNRNSEDTVSFAGETHLTWNYLYDKSLTKHKYDIAAINTSDVENYFYKQNIPASFDKGDEMTRKFVAFCCLKTSELFKSMNCQLPTKIIMTYYDNDPGTLGACYCYPDTYRNYPIRTVEFNANIDLDEMVKVKKDDYSVKHSSSKHFLQTFLHEFAHNLHFHKLYSKWGCPVPNQGYPYNPNMNKKMNILRMDIKDVFGQPANPYMDKKLYTSINDTSGYGQTKLVETFAEEFAKAVINEMDLFSLKLTANPLPMKIPNPTLNNALYEVWEGLVDDNEGLVKQVRK